MPFVPQGNSLRPGEFYIPRLGRLHAPRRLPALMSRFVAQFQVLFDAEIYIPKRLDLSAFADLADHIHTLARSRGGDAWTFERFAPACGASMGTDLTGADVNDARLTHCNLQLDTKLARLVRQEAPLYTRTEVDVPEGGWMAHCLFIPMSNTARVITHSLMVFILERRGENYDHIQGTAHLV